MPSVIQLTGAAGSRRVTFTVDDAEAARPAIDFVFDVVGAEDLDRLVEAGVVADADLPDLRVLQGLIFDHDAEGAFIRDGVAFTLGGRDLDPDAPLAASLTRGGQPGVDYARGDMAVVTSQDRTAPGPAAAPAAPAPAAPAPAPQASREDQVREYALMLFLHQLAQGYPLDVTKDHLDIEAVLNDAERRTPPLVDIDVAKALYVLSEAGKAYHRRLIDEAQDLVKRYDVYADVELDASGQARFDTGLGQDLRVPMFELTGIDPFKARFLLGLNDGEWDDLPGWRDRMQDPAWYEEVFAPVEAAPSVDELGRARLERVLEQGRAAVRDDGALRRDRY